MKKNKYHLNLDDIESVSIQHGSAIKKVFIKNDNLAFALTQIAWSRFEPGDKCEFHIHPTMIEFFFVHKGRGVFEIENETVLLKEGDFLRVSPMTKHRIITDKEYPLELIYFGISI